MYRFSFFQELKHGFEVCIDSTVKVKPPFSSAQVKTSPRLSTTTDTNENNCFVLPKRKFVNRQVNANAFLVSVNVLREQKISNIVDSRDLDFDAIQFKKFHRVLGLEYVLSLLSGGHSDHRLQTFYGVLNCRWTCVNRHGLDLRGHFRSPQGVGNDYKQGLVIGCANVSHQSEAFQRRI